MDQQNQSAVPIEACLATGPEHASRKTSACGKKRKVSGHNIRVISEFGIKVKKKYLKSKFT